ncbi:MAG: lipopolysaccharide heptosyltransferase II [Victivallaceae bacterium]|nr:lipopolysaccharide heptosyltransferase II [Victivallaceae bacterium]
MLVERKDPLSLPAPEPQAPRRVGLARSIAVRFPNWLGDFCMALPALLQLKSRFDRVTAVVPPALADFAAAIPEIDAVAALDAAHRNWSKADIERLAAAKAECGLLLNNSFRDAWNFHRAGVRPLFGAAARCRSFLLREPFQLPRVRKNRWNHLHHARKYAAMAEALGGSPWTGRFPQIAIEPAERRPDTLLLAPGAAYGAAKRWPSAAFNATARLFLAAHPAGRVVIVGGPGEVRIAEEVAAGLDRTENLCGKTGFRELAGVVAAASVCVSNDSGIMHLAAALGIPGVAPFGPTDHTSTSPVSEKWTVVSAELPCAPCFRRVCPVAATPPCMTAITAETVFEQLELLLAEYEK